MSIIGAIIAFLLIWWVILFAVLPWGATSSHEADVDLEQGLEPGAPLAPRMWRKLFVTTLISIVLWFVYYAAVKTGVAPWDVLTPQELRGESFVEEGS